jgi:hypothetical protein
MRLFFTGTGLLALAFLVHVALWHLTVPKRQTRALLLIFVLIPVVAAAASVSGLLPIFVGLSTPHALRLMLFYASCALAYICTYSAVEMPSPTLTIISYIARCGAAGCSEQQIAVRLGTNDFVGERIHAMVASRLAIIDQDNCRLTRSGRFYATLFELAAATFRLPMGG